MAKIFLENSTIVIMKNNKNKLIQLNILNLEKSYRYKMNCGFLGRVILIELICINKVIVRLTMRQEECRLKHVRPCPA